MFVSRFRGTVKETVAQSKHQSCFRKPRAFRTFQLYSMKLTSLHLSSSFRYFLPVYIDYKNANSQDPFKTRQASFQPENIQENPYGIICTDKKTARLSLVSHSLCFHREDDSICWAMLSTQARVQCGSSFLVWSAIGGRAKSKGL